MQELDFLVRGKPKKIKIRNNWSEISIAEFSDISKMFLDFEVMEKKVDKLQNTKNISEAVRGRKEKELNRIKEQYEELKTESIVFLSDLSLMDSVVMDRTDLDSVFAMVHVLRTTPPNNGLLSSFEFQGATDEEISELRTNYDDTPKWKFKTRSRLKREINKARNHTYRINDIWLHDTRTNKEYIEMAANLSKSMESGDFSTLPYLIALLTIDSDLEEIYIEKSIKEPDFKSKWAVMVDVLRERVDIFTNQKEKLSIEIGYGVMSFFLAKWEISLKAFRLYSESFVPMKASLPSSPGLSRKRES